MWPHGLGEFAGSIIRLLDLLSIAVPLILIAAAAASSRALANPCYPLRFAYSSAIVLPLLAFVSLSFSRLVSNGLYAVAGGVSADYTPIIARLEGRLLAALQESPYHEQLGRLGEVLYSTVWLVALLLAAPLFLAAGRPRAVSRLLTGWMLAPILALPVFLFFPIFEPWVLNPAYGLRGATTTAVRFLALPEPSPQLLWISSQARWAAGACLPSLHVTFPVLVSKIAFDEDAPRIGALYATIGVITGLTVLYLGRHWIVDVVAGLPFAWLVARLTARGGPSLVLPWPRESGAL
jgi:hypothetical protein